jgi:hypothetical protein
MAGRSNAAAACAALYILLRPHNYLQYETALLTYSARENWAMINRRRQRAAIGADLYFDADCGSV